MASTILDLDIDWKGLAVPFAYVLVLGSALFSFSTIYRKRKAAESANLAPWFGPHLPRNIYLSLLHMQPEDGAEDEKHPRVPDSVLRAALLRRAVEDIQRLIQIRSSKQACQQLLQRGSVGDDLWQRFKRAEKELEEELKDVVQEANALAQGWGQFIFQSAHELTANAKIRERTDEFFGQVAAEREWWEKRRGQIESQFIKELDDEAGEGAAGATAEGGSKGTSTAPPSEDEAVLIDTPGGTPSKSGKEKAQENED
ncbi:hypothetical protein N3K66_002349 [Trichothecium roseum]|uniref:Uncharacterized protein n=1 Tax=Trichothecium roseum TaxID=47278 RepID=A0ACC0V9A4_9HYPO|nr:hypothetical protein N3K66_002349 [Trichothecium roseum]